MTSLKPFNLPPKPVSIHVFLAIASSAVWLSAFAIQILHPHTKTPHHRLLPAALFAVYLIHLLVALCLPVCSRPWLWKTDSKRSLNFLEIFMFAMGWDNKGREHWAIGGTRGLIGVAVALLPFLLLPIEKSAWGMATIVAFAAESFFSSETVKHTETEGVFYAMMSGAVCATRRLFGYWSSQLFGVVVICLLFISFHVLLPFYDDDVASVGPKPIEETTNTSMPNTIS